MKKISVLLIVCGLLLAAAPAVFADDGGDTTGDITILGSAAHVETTAFVLEDHGLDGTDLGNANFLLQDLTVAGISGGTYDGLNKSWMVTDPRGTGAGWQINVSASDFTATAGPGFLESPKATIPLVGKDAHINQPFFYMQLVDKVNDGGIVWIDGQCGDVVPVEGECSEASAAKIPVTNATFTTYAALSTTPQEFVNAVPDQGMGSYYLNPEFRLFVPAETYAGKYQSAITITLIASGPDAGFTAP